MLDYLLRELIQALNLIDQTQVVGRASAYVCINLDKAARGDFQQFFLQF